MRIGQGEQLADLNENAVVVAGGGDGKQLFHFFGSVLGDKGLTAKAEHFAVVEVVAEGEALGGRNSGLFENARNTPPSVL